MAGQAELSRGGDNRLPCAARAGLPRKGAGPGVEAYRALPPSQAPAPTPPPLGGSQGEGALPGSCATTHLESLAGGEREVFGARRAGQPPRASPAPGKPPGLFLGMGSGWASPPSGLGFCRRCFACLACPALPAPRLQRPPWGCSCWGSGPGFCWVVLVSMALLQKLQEGQNYLWGQVRRKGQIQVTQRSQRCFPPPPKRQLGVLFVYVL